MAFNVITKGLVTPPVSPADEDAYLIYGVGAVGTAWEGWQGSTAVWWGQGQVWRRFELSPGNLVYCLDTGKSWIQTDNADPPTWAQFSEAAGWIQQVQLGISGTIVIPLGPQPGWTRSHGFGIPLTWELLVEPAGTVTLDIYLQPYASAPPGAGSMVGTGTKPAVVAAARATGTTATWDGSLIISPGDYMRLDVLASAVSQALTLNLIM